MVGGRLTGHGGASTKPKAKRVAGVVPVRRVETLHRWAYARLGRSAGLNGQAFAEHAPVAWAGWGLAYCGAGATLSILLLPVQHMAQTIAALTGKSVWCARLMTTAVDAGLVVCERATVRWVFRPARHKNAHRGKARAVAVGPRTQFLLTAYWSADPGEYVLSPRAAVGRRSEIEPPAVPAGFHEVRVRIKGVRRPAIVRHSRLTRPLARFSNDPNRFSPRHPPPAGSGSTRGVTGRSATRRSAR